jgi:hypothetical protein
MHCRVYVNIILMLKIDRIGVQPLILLTIDEELFKHLQYSRYYLSSFFYFIYFLIYEVNFNL